MQKILGRNTVVLLGVGHTNAHVLRMWKMDPPKNAQLVCVSDFPVVTYSGMLPGVIAGQYPKSAMEIDLIRLAQSAGARVVIGKVIGLDHQNRELIFAARPRLKFDILSIGIGSRPSFAGVDLNAGSDPIVAVKPMQTFLSRLSERLSRLKIGERQPKIAIVGGGVGSIEIAFCLYERFMGRPRYLVEGFPADLRPQIAIVTGSERIGTGLLPASISKIEKEFRDRDIEVVTQSRVTAVDANGLVFKDEQRFAADVVIWATSAVGAPLLQALDLENDNRGFLNTHQNLEVTQLPGVFAVGDTGTIVGSSISKAGVYAVRQGPVLNENIRRLINNRKDLRDYHPQTDFLKLVNLGNDRAIAEFKGRSFVNRLCWKLKDHIDVKFMRMYQDYQPMEMKPDSADTPPMRCLGCGGKIGSQILSEVLQELNVHDHPDVKIGLDNPDDAAVIATQNNQVTVTTDFFAAPFDDPYLVGRIAALNSASDCFVMGAKPNSALTIVQVPLGHPRSQIQVMRELMAGAVEEFNRMGAAVVGGHSIEGPRTIIGFTVLGNQLVEPTTKGKLKPGDRLILTKPLGTGVLLAAWMQAELPATSYWPLIASMLQSNQIALDLIPRFGINALTDVTGFGFAGHLVEMAKASMANIRIDNRRIPTLPGCNEAIAAGVQSTLAPDNRALSGRIEIRSKVDLMSSELAALFDPQTGGGLLFGIEAARVDECVAFLHESGFVAAGEIGEVVSIGKAAIDIDN